MTQLNHRQIAMRVARDLPRGAFVRLGSGLPLLVPGYVASDTGIVFARDGENAEGAPPGHVDYLVLGAREVAQNGDCVVPDAPHDPAALARLQEAAGTARHVCAIASFFGPDGRPVLVPQCSMVPHATGCVTRLYTDIAVFDLRNGEAWLREIAEGITLYVLQAEIDVQLRVAEDLKLLEVPNSR